MCDGNCDAIAVIERMLKLIEGMQSEYNAQLSGASQRERKLSETVTAMVVENKQLKAMLAEVKP